MNIMNYEIIDFHTHPFMKDKQNICIHNEYMKITPNSFKSYMEDIGISKVCGLVIYSGNNSLEKMVENHKNLVFVAAHPGEYKEFMKHLQRMKMSENYYLDISGTGVFRHGLIRHAIDDFGKERILFGSDFPVCNPSVYLGAVLMDISISDTEKEYILCKNAKRLLNIK